MLLPWIRLDTALPDHPKVLALIESKEGKVSAFVHLCAMCYAGRHGTDGFVPRQALPKINGRASDADRLVKAGLWIKEEGGWSINGWHEYQASKETTKARSDAARKAANTRWGKRDSDAS